MEWQTTINLNMRNVRSEGRLSPNMGSDRSLPSDMTGNGQLGDVAASNG